MTTDREQWLTLTAEKALEPRIGICDPHLHMWDYPDNRYTDVEFLRDVADNNVVKSVFVECHSSYRPTGPEEMKPVGEVEFVEAIAARNATQKSATEIATGIVGHADLTLGDGVTRVLEALIEAAKGRLKGIRHSTAWDADPSIPTYGNSPAGVMMDKKFRLGFARLEELGLCFDAWAYFPQLMELFDLAKANPRIPVVLNHFGGPIHVGPYAAKRAEVMAEWKRGMETLASCSNVLVKLGGMGMTRLGFEWHKRQKPVGSVELAQASASYYVWCIERFGVDRCMFESNFPVDRASVSYTVTWNSFKRLVKDFSAREQSALFYDTAAKAYKLDAGG